MTFTSLELQSFITNFSFFSKSLSFSVKNSFSPFSFEGKGLGIGVSLSTKFSSSAHQSHNSSLKSFVAPTKSRIVK
jgi:hypothetical protein